MLSRLLKNVVISHHLYFPFLNCPVLPTLSSNNSRLIIMEYFFVKGNASHVAYFNSPSGFVHLLLFPLLFFDISLQSLRNISVSMISTFKLCKALPSCICSLARTNQLLFRNQKDTLLGQTVELYQLEININKIRKCCKALKIHKCASNIIIHSKYFPVHDWSKPHAQFTITSCC